MKEFFDIRLRPFIEASFNIANKSELLQVIYSIDGENIEVDLANEFLSEAFFDEKPIFNDFVIEFDKDAVGLNEDDKIFYLKLIKMTKEFLKQKGMPQSASELIAYFEKIGLINNTDREKERLKRFLLVSNIPRDSTEKFGLRRWRYFDSYTLHCMIERALVEIGKPAHFTQIALLMNEMFPKYGPFNAQNVHGRMGSIKETFIWLAPGVYGLKRWGIKHPPYIKDYLVELLKLANRPLHISLLTEEALKKCNCSKSSVSMTLTLNKDTFIKYPDNFFGLIEWE
jgi:hypothetical protein